MGGSCDLKNVSAQKHENVRDPSIEVLFWSKGVINFEQFLVKEFEYCLLHPSKTYITIIICIINTRERNKNQR